MPAADIEVFPRQGEVNLTARLVAYDAGRDLVDVPYVVLERVRGSDLADGPEAYASVGRTLAVLHRLRLAEVGPIDGVSEPFEFDSAALLRSLCGAGELGSAQASWLAAWFDTLAARGTVGADHVLLHGDVLPSNLVVDESGQVVALLGLGLRRMG